MKTNIVMKSQDRNLFGTVIRQETKSGFLNVSDLTRAYEIERSKKGWSYREPKDILKLDSNAERAFYILQRQGYLKDTKYDLEDVENQNYSIKGNIYAFMKDVKKEGLAKVLKERNAVLNVFLGFQSQTFLFNKLKELSENIFIATDDGSFGFHGNVVELLRKSATVYDEYFACGPKVMLKALSEYASNIERNVQVSIEERMGCGYGACVGCSCKIRGNGVVLRKSVCKHGPVFSGKDVVWDE